MSRPAGALISVIRANVHSLLYDEVINQTIVVMRDLSTALSELAALVREDNTLSGEQKAEVAAILTPLTSESIREALHKGELHITNRIIKTKNRILTGVGAAVPDGHDEIDPNDYPNYHW
jgi:hypothetical protein